MKYLILIALVVIQSEFSLALTHQFETDWKPHRVCTKDTRTLKNYCLELMELEKSEGQSPKKVIILLSGLFQNTNAWDLIAQKEISVARYLRDKFNAKIFVLHNRGISASDYIAQTNLDDLAIDDLTAAVAFVIKTTFKRPYLIGHSQGAIIAQAYSAGLSRCGIKNNCFLKPIARARNLALSGIGLIAGNVTIAKDDPNSFLIPLARTARSVPVKLLLKSMDHIGAQKLANNTGTWSMLKIWKHVYNVKNVSKESRVALWQKSVDSTTGAILIQFSNAIKDEDISSVGGHSYQKNLGNISAKLYQIVMKNDKLSPPKATVESFKYIGSKDKKIEVIQNRGHLDFQMNKELHKDLDNMMKYLL